MQKLGYRRQDIQKVPHVIGVQLIFLLIIINNFKFKFMIAFHQIIHD